MTHVLLTGATGFVGRHVATTLAERGAKITVIIRHGTCHRLSIEPTTIIETDDLFAHDAAWWRTVMSDVEMVLHLAWIATPGRYLTDPINLDCLRGTLSLAAAARSEGIRRFVSTGTCLEYAMTGRPLCVDGPLDPRSLYAAAKASAYLSLRALFARTETRFLWARLFHLYGPGEHPRRLFAYLHGQMANGQPAELGSGAQVRDFIDVRAAAKMIVGHAFSDTQDAVNIGAGRGQTVREMAEHLATTYGRSDLLRFGARPDPADEPCHIVADLDVPRANQSHGPIVHPSAAIARPENTCASAAPR